MYYLGIDVSKKTIDCCLISDSIFYERRFDNIEDGFRRLDDWIQEYTTETVHCCCEATGIYHEAIAAHLRQKHIVSIVNPSKIKGFREAEQTRTKTDRQDARLIAEYCRRMQPKEWQPPTEEQKYLQAITDYIARLKQQRAAEQTKHQTAPDTIRHHIQTETFAKFLSPNSRNPNTGFRLFLFQISTDSTQIPLNYPCIPD